MLGPSARESVLRDKDLMASTHPVSDPELELFDEQLVCRRFSLGALGDLDPWELLAAIPKHKSYRVFAEPDGPLRIGMGAAARIARAPGRKPIRWSTLFDAMRAALGPLGAGTSVFFSSAFDAQQPFDELWEGFAPVELCVADATWEFGPAGITMTVVASQPTFERTYDAAIAVVRASRDRRAQPEVTLIDFGDEAYADAVRAALDRIGSGVASKIVAARPIDLQAEGEFSVPDLCRELQSRFSRCFVFAHRPGGSHRGAAPTFLGASPERLVAVRDGRVHTGAIAGTAPRGVSARMDERHAQELLTSDKEMREHEAVSDMIVEALRPFCSEVEQEPVRFLKLPNVQHLWSPIGGPLRAEKSVLDVAEALHPTPAVGGVPREAAVDAIRTIESAPRGLYAGVIGSVNLDGSGELAVAIRSALVHGDRARLFAGAGIVDGSDPDREVAETRAKARAILDVLEPQ